MSAKVSVGDRNSSALAGQKQSLPVRGGDAEDVDVAARVYSQALAQLVRAHHNAFCADFRPWVFFAEAFDAASCEGCDFQNTETFAEVGVGAARPVGALRGFDAGWSS